MCWNILPEALGYGHDCLDKIGPIQLRLDTLSAHFLKSHIYKYIAFSMNDRETGMLRKVLKRKDRKLKVITAVFEIQGELTKEMFDEEMKVGFLRVKSSLKRFQGLKSKWFF